jgi:hypothetical protein
MLLLGLLAPSLWAGVARGEPSHRDETEPPRIAFTRNSLESLLIVPNRSFSWPSESTDDSLAIAVALGNDPSLERKSNFRKKKFDLFRTERAVTILEREMLLRFRLRAKAKETVSVELRF